MLNERRSLAAVVAAFWLGITSWSVCLFSMPDATPSILPCSDGRGRMKLLADNILCEIPQLIALLRDPRWNPDFHTAGGKKKLQLPRHSESENRDGSLKAQCPPPESNPGSH